jgi:hypothetical protein
MPFAHVSIPTLVARLRLAASIARIVSNLVNRDISTAKGSRKPVRLDCL